MCLVTLIKALESGALDHLKKDFHDYFEKAEVELKSVLDEASAGKSPDDIETDIRDVPLLAYWAEHGHEDLSIEMHELLKLLRDHGFLPKTILSDLKEALDSLSSGPHVATDGAIWGTRPFEQLNLGWIYAPLNDLLTNVYGKRPFSTSPTKHTVAAEFSMAILGDWGTGYTKDHIQLPAQNVLSAACALNPNYMVHIGDVYYTGQPTESVKCYLPETKHPAELARFVDLWSEATSSMATTSFTLNSNHEMYCGAWGYFENALTDEVFSAQDGCSYFALQNEHWLILGLDSAYEATNLYNDGQLNQAQIDWAQQVVENAGDRKIFVITHHPGTNFAGTTRNRLWDNVTTALNGRAPDYWYWGHVHNGVVYKPSQSTGPDGSSITTYARLAGHGAIPFGKAKLSGVDYYAHTPTNNSNFPKSVRNGFALITFKESSIVETFYEVDEQGQSVLAWSSEG